MLGLLAILTTAFVPRDTVWLRPGMVLTHSAVVLSDGAIVRPLPGDSVVLRVRGEGIVLDFAGGVVAGATPTAPPDSRSGYGVLIEGGRDITLRNAVIRGFKVGVLARGVTGLVIERIDVSDNWAPRLWSGRGHESLTDWLYYHQNERDEWLRYGAGLYLADIRGGTITASTATGGQNGLLVVRSSGLQVYNNTFSWLSGLGIGLYRSRGNRIMHNRLDWCVRGQVEGVYSRGQDSAALLLYEQSSDNTVAYNSMTHSGDGIFLWAGQSTMDSGRGGSNDNLFFGNDVSFAVTNGVELTFSRNRLVGNRIEGGLYGVWGGYSHQTEIRGNTIIGNPVGIAIEHGQDNLIMSNRFEDNATAVRLWANPSEPADWAYPKHRDTRSRDVRLLGNQFDRSRVALRIDRTTGVTLGGNRFAGVDTMLLSATTSGGFRVLDRGPGRDVPSPGPWRPDLTDRAAPQPREGGIMPWIPQSQAQGRHQILVGEWGPYDGRHPTLWPARLADSAWNGGPLALVTLGPPGRWRVAASSGISSVSLEQGVIGDTLVLTPAPGKAVDVDLELEYVGGPVRAPGPVLSEAGVPYRFRFSRFLVPLQWTVAVFGWDSMADPRTGPPAVERIQAGAPVTRFSSPGLDWMWYRPRLAGIPAERFLVEAETAVDLPDGEYDIVTISDDGIRVWVDDTLAIDHWQSHESAVDRAPVRGGPHRIRVHYYQVDGWVELRVELRKR